MAEDFSPTCDRPRFFDFFPGIKLALISNDSALFVPVMFNPKVFKLFVLPLRLTPATPRVFRFVVLLLMSSMGWSFSNKSILQLEIRNRRASLRILIGMCKCKWLSYSFTKRSLFKKMRVLVKCSICMKTSFLCQKFHSFAYYHYPKSVVIQRNGTYLNWHIPNQSTYLCCLEVWGLIFATTSSSTSFDGSRSPIDSKDRFFWNLYHIVAHNILLMTKKMIATISMLTRINMIITNPSNSMFWKWLFTSWSLSAYLGFDCQTGFYFLEQLFVFIRWCSKLFWKKGGIFQSRLATILSLNNRKCLVISHFWTHTFCDLPR